MPRLKENRDPDPDFRLGFTRKKEGYDRSRDTRGITRQLLKLKGKRSETDFTF